MAAKSLRDLFIEELRDAYDGEKRLLKALPKLAKAATNEELQEAFTTHATETEGQVARLEEVFRAIGEPARGKKCDGIIGIVEEANSMIEELDEGPILDAALIAGAQRAEHYEISAYGTLAHFADILGEQEAKDLLGETLDEEKAADEKLNTIAKSDVNRQALTGEGDEAEEESSGRGVRGGMRRMAESMAMANERTGSRTSSRGGSGRRAGRSSGRASASGRSRTSGSSSKKR
jgi:ferritin-like metal-binding protein YciE